MGVPCAAGRVIVTPMIHRDLRGIADMEGHRDRLLHRIGLLCLGLSVLVLIMMGPLWERIGVWSMVLWMSLGGAGMLLLQKGPKPEVPD